MCQCHIIVLHLSVKAACCLLINRRLHTRRPIPLHCPRMANTSETAVKNIGKVLNDPSRPMKERFRALFTLKNLGGETAIECISQCFVDESVLLKHELAYCLGQMQDERAIPVLQKVLEDVNQDPIVRHEAG